MGTFNGTAYGPSSLSSGHVNVAGYAACVPGTVTNGMPIGPPSHWAAPKSAWKPRDAPIVLTIAAEFDSTGSVSTGVFQMLFGGRIEQCPRVCSPRAGTATSRL